MDDDFPHDDDGPWITTCETRDQQLLRKDAHPESVLSEKDTQSRDQQLLRKDAHPESVLSDAHPESVLSEKDTQSRDQQLLRKDAHPESVLSDAHPESVLSEKDTQSRDQQLLRKDAHPESVLSDAHPEGVLSEKDMQLRQAFRLQTWSDEKNELKAGISCNLCFISASDNALMEQHLMGPAHVRNVEREVKKCRGKIEFQKNSSVTNETVDAIASVVEVRNCLQDRIHDEIVKSVVEDRNVMDDNETVTLSMKNKNNKNEVIVVQGETTDEMNNCELCKFFQGDNSEFQKYQIPEHFCQNFYKSPELPEGWTEMTSRTSGCSYYINNVTKVKQWQWPTQPAGAEWSGTAEHRTTNQTTAKDELPHGWVKKKAKSNGLPFYVNKVTNDWQWDRPTELPPSKVPGDFSAATSKDVEKNSDNSPGVTKAGMMVSKLKVTNSKSKEEALASNEVEKLPVKSPTMTRTGEMISNLNKSVTINQEDQLKLDLKHWKQATEQWNNL